MAFTAYVFDAYGTLFDVHAAVRRHADAMGPDAEVFSEMWRAKQLEYSWIRTLMGAYADFWTLTMQALDHTFQRFPSANPALKQPLLDAYWQLDCYPEVPTVLKNLKAGGARIAILSNGTDAMLKSAVGKAGLDLVVDDIFSVEAVRAFKTAPAAYDIVTTHYRLYPSAVSFQSSNRWDIAGATKFGFRTVWINRANRPDEYVDFGPAVILPSLESLQQHQEG
ncbi:haloacid dehalogenase type II [Pararhizobium arenae]|uniref:haloacid dehalogenase type II n=1 Tax=Pararhizobium arenae TaxID=1856850 RepID=UPI00094AAA59|nr:haloacid dehalogenase type II [Pararhizobium arenae]